ncbi:MAG: hypothetical protein QOE19_200 [Actinomycetota bacterium]|jgi:butyryl-CoA dehydrogenase|nr:hypothetical protein [Actinomycetota bacterium]MDQ1667393.1 hypothetical protein [Actinomycetota bacterium]
MDFQLTDEQRMLVEAARDVAKRGLSAQAARWDQEDVFPRENVPTLASAGLLGLTLPEEYGGGGGTILDLVLAMEQIATVCPPSAFILGCQTGLGAKAISMYGSEDLKSALLPKFCTGEKLIAWAMSEPGAGSDIGGMHTNAVRTGSGYRVSGEKTWISLATAADVFVVITRFEGAPGLKGLGAVIVDRDTPGLQVGKKVHTMGMRGTGMASVLLDGCEVPDENVLLGPGQYRALLAIMSGERVAGNPPVSLGIAGAALTAAKAYLGAREAFGQKLSEFQGLRWKLADMAIQLECARVLVYRAAANAGSGLPSTFEASVAKVVANEAAVAIADAALQIHGAAGYGLEFPVERMARDARGMCIGDGTVEIQRNLIAAELLGRVGR